jgi:hypothetical protein
MAMKIVTRDGVDDLARVDAALADVDYALARAADYSALRGLVDAVRALRRIIARDVLDGKSK